VVLARTGAGWGVGPQHNHNVEAWFVHSPGLKVLMPSNAADFKGLLKSAIRDDNPVLLFADLGLLHTTGEVPEGEHVVYIGKSTVCRVGTDVTLISYGKTVYECIAAARYLQESGVSAEVLDLRTLKPLDEDGVLASVRKTGRAVVVHEAAGICGVGAEICAVIAEKAFKWLKAPLMRVTGQDAPNPASSCLEHAYAPHADRIAAAARCQMQLRAA